MNLPEISVTRPAYLPRTIGYRRVFAGDFAGVQTSKRYYSLSSWLEVRDEVYEGYMMIVVR